MAEICDAVKNAPPTSRDVIEDLTVTVEMATLDITSFKAHQLRHINQDKARTDALSKISNEQVLFTQDWAMKFLPKKYRVTDTVVCQARAILAHYSCDTFK